MKRITKRALGRLFPKAQERDTVLEVLTLVLMVCLGVGLRDHDGQLGGFQAQLFNPKTKETYITIPSMT